MKREIYDDYIRRFNAQDMSAFDRYIAPDLRLINGLLEIRGVQGMKDHYAKIWRGFTERLHVERFVSDDTTLAVQLWAHFTATHDDADSLFGYVEKGETFDYRGVIIYEITDEKFSSIRVAYNSFTYTNNNGKAVEMGIPH